MLPIIYRTDADSPSGYSRAARMHMRAFLECGYDNLKIEHVKKDATTIAPDEYWLKEMAPRIIHPGGLPHLLKDKCIRIWHETPDFFSPEQHTYDIGMVPWETSRIISNDINNNPRFNWVKQMNRMNEIWTNAKSTVKAYRDSGVTVPIHVFPHPIDLDTYKPSERNPMYNEFGKVIPPQTMILLSIFQWIRRKNPAGLLNGYWSTFNGIKDVVMCIKTYNRDFQLDDREGVGNMIKALKQNLRISDAPPLQAIWAHVPDGEMCKLYSSCDVYALLPFGEGFGLPFQEAMACGKPCIFPRSSSMLDFIDDTVGYGVDTDEEPVTGMPTAWYNGEQDWWRPRFISIKKAFKAAYDDWKSGAIVEKGKAARKRIEELHSFKKVGSAMIDRIKQISRPNIQSSIMT